MAECFDFTAHRIVAAQDVETSARLSLRAALAIWVVASGAGWGLIAWFVATLA